VLFRSSQQTATESVVPDAASQGPVIETPPPYKFAPFEFEVEPGGQKLRVESEDELREAFRLKSEFGRQTRKHAADMKAERDARQEEKQRAEEELQLLRDLQKRVAPILDGLKAKPELNEYLREELGLDVTPDPRDIELNQRLTKLEQFEARAAMRERRTEVIGVVDAIRRHPERGHGYGYDKPITREEVATVEHYAQTSGLPLEKLYSHPLIFAGVYTHLVGLGAIAPPQIPVQPGAPGNGVRDKLASAANLPPASSGAPAAPKPYSHEGKTPDDVLRDLAKMPDSGVDDDVLEAMGLKPE